MSVSDINYMTTRIEIVRSDEVIGSATGFFFRYDGIEYLATNRHVVLDEESDHFPDSLRISLHANRSDLIQNVTVTVLLHRNLAPIWLQHPSYGSNKCDVVLIPLNENTLLGKELRLYKSASITCIGSDLINTRDVNPFGSVVIIGYPRGFHDKLHNLPIYRNATIASCYGVDFDGLPYFLVDANLHPGTSGSPVVSSHHTLFKEGDGKEGYAFFGVLSAEQRIGGDPLGLNVVWYARLLVEIGQQ